MHVQIQKENNFIWRLTDTEYCEIYNRLSQTLTQHESVQCNAPCCSNPVLHFNANLTVLHLHKRLLSFLEGLCSNLHTPNMLHDHCSILSALFIWVTLPQWPITSLMRGEWLLYRLLDWWELEDENEVHSIKSFGASEEHFQWMKHNQCLMSHFGF